MNGSHSRNPSDSMHDGRGRRPSVQPAAINGPPMTRAERFEDEKRRLIESCFSKLDQNNQLAESYITHIRVEEDAAHPSTPPPPNSPPQNKKPRIVVVAVRSTGRVRMHKARENNNGSFSIGKTWNLEDLSAIESFAHPDPNAPPAKQNFYQWASGVGFVVTISKPYYWQAATAKEKDFFIASLVKIYRKYTKGQIPDLRGFDPREMDAMTGAMPGQPQQQQPPRSSPALQDRLSPQNTPPPPRPPFAAQKRPSSQDSRSRFRPSPDHVQGQTPPPNHPQARPKPSTERGLRQPQSRERLQKPSREQLRAPSRDRMQPGPGQPPPGSRPRLTPKSSRAELQSAPTESPGASLASSTRGNPPFSEAPPSREGPPSQLAPSRIAERERQQSYQSVRSDRSLQSQRSYESHQVDSPGLSPGFGPGPSGPAPGIGLGLSASTAAQWKPASREPSPRRAPSPIRPHSPLRPQSPMTSQSPMRPQSPMMVPSPRRAPQQPHPATLDQREPDRFPGTMQAPPERKRPFMAAGGRKYSAAPSETESDSEALRPPPLSTSRNVSAAGRPQSPRIEKPPTPVDPDRIPGAFYDTPTASTSNLSTQAPRTAPEPEPRPVEPAREPTLPTVAAREPTLPAVAAQEPSLPTFEPEPSLPSAQPPVQPPVQPEAPSEPVTDSEPIFSETETENEAEAHRPGLGPMIKKKSKPGIADAFKRAAAAHHAFKPRAGGAGERMRALAVANKELEPDGITGVVPAPLRKMSVDVDRTESPISPTKPDFPPTVPEATSETESRNLEPEPLPKVADESEAAPKPIDGATLEEPIPIKEEPQQPEESEMPIAAPAPEPRRPKRRSAQQENYLRSLNIDPRLLDGRGLQFESILSDFGWGSGILKGRQLEDLEADLKRELGRVEAGSWLGHLEQKDDRVEVVDQMLDRAIAECDELDGLLTIYSAELSTLNDDIAFIEAQSQGLQVQTANQKILHAELQKLVDTISISPQQLQPLRRGDLGHPESLMTVESSLLVLYKAMVTIDPSVRSSAAGRPIPVAGIDASDIGTMNALQEKRQAYIHESQEFCQRLMRHLDASFGSALNSAKPSLLQASGGIGSSMTKLNGPGFNLARSNLWQFSPLLLFTKEINLPAWQTLLRMYYSKARPLYTDVFRDNITHWKKGARKPTGEAADLLFTSVEKESSEGLTSTARKLTVKRSQTLAKTFRSTSGDKPSPADRQAGRLQPFDVFNGVLEEQVPLVSMEQNFIVDLFHATSLENIEFADAVMASVPEARMGPDLTGRRLMEPDRAMARRVSDSMEETFGFWAAELRTLMEWAVAGDPLQGVGILTGLAIHAHRLQETSQEFLLHNLNAVSARLQTLFQKFVDEQIHAIEDTKVKIKKRKGVIAFMKIFPTFSAAVENTYFSAAGRIEGSQATVGARQLIDDAYIRINKAMWDSLKVIARESPTAPGAVNPAAQGMEFEDKEILNYHILLIENMNHYIEEVDDGGKEGSILAEWKAKALMDRAEHMEEYVGRVVRRPLGKVIDFVESTESLLNQNMSGPSIAARPSYSRSSAKKILAAHDSKEIRRGIEHLRKRIEKHFGESDEEQLSRQLVNLVCKECERRYDGILERLQRVCRELYKEEEKGVEIEWTKEDTKVGFKRF